MPCRISPTTSALMKTSASACARCQASRCGFGWRRRSPETTFVSSRKATSAGQLDVARTLARSLDLQLDVELGLVAEVVHQAHALAAKVTVLRDVDDHGHRLAVPRDDLRLPGLSG